MSVTRSRLRAQRLPRRSTPATDDVDGGRDGDHAHESGLIQRVLELQSSVGNAAVQRLLQREPTAIGEAPAAAATDASGAEPEVPTTRRTLRFGASGDDVRELQSRLNRAPEAKPHLAVDNIFGQQTLAAVKSFQAAHPPLVVDGAVGPLTWAQIDSIPSEPAEADADLASKIFERGATEFAKGRYAHAYDFFTRSYELNGLNKMLFNRAQALRKLGARREEAIALYEAYIAGEGGERKAEAAGYVAELRGPGKTGDEAADKTAANALFEKAAALYGARSYALAYDEFSKAYEASPRTGLLYDRAPMPAPVGRSTRRCDQAVRGIPGPTRWHAPGTGRRLPGRAPRTGRHRRRGDQRGSRRRALRQGRGILRGGPVRPCL
jgi:tetratricopeptide (TPR) repeat protein